MSELLKFFTNFITDIVEVLNKVIFPGSSISYLQLILATIIIGMIFKLIFGGLKETDHLTDLSLGVLRNTKQSKDINNHDRKKQINDEYVPRHARKDYVPRHARKE